MSTARNATKDRVNIMNFSKVVTGITQDVKDLTLSHIELWRPTSEMIASHKIEIDKSIQSSLGPSYTLFAKKQNNDTGLYNVQKFCGKVTTDLTLEQVFQRFSQLHDKIEAKSKWGLLSTKKLDTPKAIHFEDHPAFNQ